MKNGTKHQSAYRSTNIGENAYEAINISSGGSHIHASANVTASRARIHPRQPPHTASAAITGNAKLPTPLLNSANGAHHRGRSIHPVAPWANALAPVRSAGSATIKKSAAPAPSAAAIAKSRAIRDGRARHHGVKGKASKHSPS